MAGGRRFIHTGDKDRLAAFVKDAIEDTRRQYDALLARYGAGLEKEIDALGAIEELKQSRGTSPGSNEAHPGSLPRTTSVTVTGVANALTQGGSLRRRPRGTVLHAEPGHSSPARLIELNEEVVMELKQARALAQES
jgi:hypothetical protein